MKASRYNLTAGNASSRGVDQHGTDSLLSNRNPTRLRQLLSKVAERRPLSKLSNPTRMIPGYVGKLLGMLPKI